VKYPHQFSITRDSGGTQAANGAWNAGSALVLYSGDGDWQEMSEGLSRPIGEARDDDANGRGYLAEPETVLTLKPGDLFTVTYPDGTVRSGHVTRIRSLDDSFDGRVS